ncbi:urease accessory protein UreF [Hahella sp. KA22]|uniref:urease accessory protein UreF n=1 Tax=Hahella sp. KA22 TaxID=1628392 RepID=UPI000FDDCA4D|nr:urease accessory UreF family protein [Hahella sp. KA22]AZZ93373.1 urease accessory protein UreF [Hahella sp. KA22]QAY56748.1 urease accessory protein UreF [Hahella sp. KA22]
MPPLALLKLMNLTSPALPVGAFAYSQGLEWAIDHGGVDTPEKIHNWLQGVISQGLGKTDLPVLFKLLQAWRANDHEQINYWNAWLLAARETQELLDEDRHVGKALAKLLRDLGVPGAEPWLAQPASLLTLWTLACAHWDIDAENAALGFLWSWLENQIAVAGKTLPLAQTAAQRILQRLMPVLTETVAAATQIKEENFGASLPGWAMACANHETQYSRLFRS